jgi:hypothetical protein
VSSIAAFQAAPAEAQGTPNFIPKFDASGKPTANSIMFDNGNVGIGTTHPTVLLDVAQNNAIRIGNAYISSGEDPLYAYAMFASNAWYNGNGGVVSQIPDPNRKSGLLEFANDELNIWQTQTAGKTDWANRLFIASGGNVGTSGRKVRQPRCKLAISVRIRTMRVSLRQQEMEHSLEAGHLARITAGAPLLLLITASPSATKPLVSSAW